MEEDPSRRRVFDEVADDPAAVAVSLVKGRTTPPAAVSLDEGEDDPSAAAIAVSLVKHCCSLRRVLDRLVLIYTGYHVEGQAAAAVQNDLSTWPNPPSQPCRREAVLPGEDDLRDFSPVKLTSE